MHQLSDQHGDPQNPEGDMGTVKPDQRIKAELNALVVIPNSSCRIYTLNS